ncbi:MAG TPA: GNAT family N-acetyltransferase [Rhizomicrobium sp.]|jgi:GNAT superfamily N-acetyltransferase|nr:GNAT family N-acetyltransferase [Rhizomicrobium sp.]
MSIFSIRAATESDAHLIVSLLRELADYEKLQNGFLLDEAAAARDMLGAACRSELVFVDGAAVGIAAWFWIYKSFGAARGVYVEDLYVRPGFRGRGLGRALLAHLAAKAHAVGGFMEWQVLDWNTPSVEFYKGLGANSRDNWINYRLTGEALRKLAS